MEHKLCEDKMCIHEITLIFLQKSQSYNEIGDLGRVDKSQMKYNLQCLPFSINYQNHVTTRKKERAHPFCNYKDIISYLLQI